MGTVSEKMSCQLLLHSIIGVLFEDGILIFKGIEVQMCHLHTNYQVQAVL